MSDQKPAAVAAVIVPAAAMRAGYKVAYPVDVNGKEIISRGEVFSFRRVGHNRAEITLLHAKTGSFFTNVIKGGDPVQVHSDALVAEPTDALSVALMEHVKELLKSQASDFYSIFPIED
jgi:hypothetical protein